MFNGLLCCVTTIHFNKFSAYCCAVFCYTVSTAVSAMFCFGCTNPLHEQIVSNRTMQMITYNVTISVFQIASGS